MDTVEKIEEYLESLEQYIFSSFSSARTDLPNVQDAVNRLWVDISRYGPPIPKFPEMHIPVLGDFQVPPPPPPPPPPPHLIWLKNSLSWSCEHPLKTSSIAFGVIGATLLVGYRSKRSQKYKMKSSQRREVVVILGGDTPLGFCLISQLEEQGFIVIASVATSEAALLLEQRCQGYVRALVLNPQEPETATTFSRSLSSALSRRFPVNSVGDPYASPLSHPYIQSVVCLLTLPTTISSVCSPFEHISLRDTYLPYLNTTQITPLQALQSILPLLRNGPARARNKGQKKIIVCLPAIETCVGLPFGSIQAMSATSTLRGIDVLRREINLVSLMDESESLKNIKILVANVGALDFNKEQGTLLPSTTVDPPTAIQRSSECLSSDDFSASALQARHPHSPWNAAYALFRLYGINRRPTDTRVFVDNIISIIAEGKNGRHPISEKVRNWIRGDRFSIGAGAQTYWIASQLPSVILEPLLNLPYFLLSIRNRLFPSQPFIVPDGARNVSDERSDKDSRRDFSETNSEGELESSSEAGDGTWIRLRKT